MHDVTRPTAVAQPVDNTDWLKTAAIIFVSVDHIGYFFVDDEQWWSVVGRLGAPPFFFLMGYAQTRTVPLRWIWLGVILTLLDGWNAGWTWVAPNILLSFALIRLARPYLQTFVQRHGWTAFALIVAALFAVLPIAGKTVDYGAEGWLWAMFGLCQRMYADLKSAADVDSAAQGSPPGNTRLMRLLACLVAVVVYVWQEQKEFSFSQIQFATFILIIGSLSTSLCLFLRGPSRIQPPAPGAVVLRFVGRRTLEIYAIQLAGFELIIKLIPGLAP
jgi:TraX protein